MKHMSTRRTARKSPLRMLVESVAKGMTNESYYPGGLSPYSGFEFEDHELYPHIYVGLTDEYYNPDEDSVYEQDWWTWSENPDDTAFAAEGPVFEITDEGREYLKEWDGYQREGTSMSYMGPTISQREAWENLISDAALVKGSDYEWRDVRKEGQREARQGELG